MIYPYHPLWLSSLCLKGINWPDRGLPIEHQRRHKAQFMPMAEHGSTTLYTGPYHALESAFLASFPGGKFGLSPVSSTLVVAPSRRLARRLESALVASRGFSAGVHFHTFFSLSAAITAEDGGLGRPLLSDSGLSEFALRRVLGGMEPAWAGNRGYVSAVRGAVRDLADSLADEGIMKEHMAEGAFEDERDELARLLEIRARYEKLLSELPTATNKDLFLTAAEKASSSPFLDRFDRIIYYGFYDLTGLQFEFFRNVTAGRNCAVYFPYFEHPACSFAKRFAEGRIYGLAAEHVRLPENFGSRALSGALSSIFTESSSAESPGPDRLSVVSASGFRDEVWVAAKEVLRLHEKDGVPYGSIGVVARALEPYRDHLRSVFAENRIPFETSGKTPLLSFPAAAVMAAFASFSRNGLDARDLYSLLSFGAFCPEKVSPRWKPLVAACGSCSGLRQWETLLSPDSPDFLFAGDRQASQDCRELLAFIRKMDRELKHLSSPGSWKELSSRCAALMDSYFLADRFKGEALQARNAVTGHFGPLAAYDTVAPAQEGEFLDELRSRLEASSLKYSPCPGGVQVLDAMAARGLQFDSLILLGANEKMFPRVIREDPVLRDKTRSFMRDHEGFWISPKIEGYEEERMLFHFAISSASRKVTVLYRRSDDDGKPEVRSIYLDRLAQACGLELDSRPGEVRDPRLGYVLKQPLEKLGGAFLDEIFLSRREASALAVLSPDCGLAGERAGILPEGTAALGAAAENMAGPSPCGYDGLCGGLGAEDAPKSYSATSLQTLLNCPLSYFFGRMLRLGEEAPEQDSETPDKRKLGTLCHAAFERWQKGLAENGFWNSPDPKRYAQALLAAAESVLPPENASAMGLYPLVWKSRRRRLLASLETMAVEDFESLGGYVPAFQERKLSGGLEGVQGFSFNGKADRIDVCDGQAAFRVMDYKITGRDYSLGKDVASGEKIQLFLYMELASALFPPEREFKLGGARLLFVERGEGVKPFAEVEAGQYFAAREATLMLIASAVRSASAGDFYLRPDSGDFGYCSFCPYGGICRKNHPASVYRAARNKNLRERDSLAERARELTPRKEGRRAGKTNGKD